ncbi:Histidine kinase osmosensor [Scheffersomyces spartinae]|uniref:histidine kinase n=1 Tax=Scheffersomyces spartinae TaxID=45513 RepID=A0A9P7V5I2_9ASCO|nr:Histidine kinase osmosensor [Scheffersomyces spartinae]KAG7191657.1 Histidine kinase osmosensor [Scheffersomyces spartinae]
MRTERLQVIAQLKTIQLQQALQAYYNLGYFLLNRYEITLALTSYKAGNTSVEVFEGAQRTLFQYVDSLDFVAGARLYDLGLNLVVNATSNTTLLSDPTKDYLYPIRKNISISNILPDDDYFVTGPVANSSVIDSAYFLGLTLPVFSNSSIIISKPSILGYLTIICNIYSIQYAVNGSINFSTDTASSSSSTSSLSLPSSNLNDFSVIAVQAVYNQNSDVNSGLYGFRTVIPDIENVLEPNTVYSINTSSAVKEALSRPSGSAADVQLYSGRGIAIGFQSLAVDSVKNWTIIVMQSRSSFLGPFRKLRSIIIGVSVGIGAFICLLTFPLAYYFIRPITKLKEATESITRSKKKEKQIPSPPYSRTLYPWFYRKQKVSEDEDGSLQTLLQRMPDNTTASNGLSFSARKDTGAGAGASNGNVDIGQPLTARDMTVAAPSKRQLPMISKVKRQSKGTAYPPIVEKTAIEDNNNIGDEEEQIGLNNFSMKRDSIHSELTSGYSTAIRLPQRIVNSKKFFKDELTELTDAFNIMIEELDKQYTHLEDRVKLRTKELEASKIEAEAANEAKTVFIANISHELRTPLNGILGMTSIAMDEEDQSKIQDSLKLIHRSGELLLHILTELLTYSKNTLNRSKLETSNFQILEVAYQVKSIFSKLAVDQKVNFKILLEPRILRKMILYGDSNRLIQIVMNLVSNSLKFTPVNGSVDVSFKLLGEYDHQKSKACDYEQVYVLRNPFDETKLNTMKGEVDNTTNESTLQSSASDYFQFKHTGTTNIREQQGAPDKSHTTGASTNHHTTTGIKVGKIEEINESMDYDASDTVSVVTLSTQAYENNIFESQFTRHKALPPTPVDSTSTVEDISPPKGGLLHPDDPHSSPLGGHNNTSNSDEVHVYAKSPRGTGSGSSPSITRPNNTRANTESSYIGHNELIKNKKTFKMRNFYKPKVWVLQIEVRDTGSGIEPALQEKVFEPFVQGDQTLSRSYGGTGLGLSICRQLAKMMRGSLTLKSSLGVGSTFTLRIPIPQSGEIIVPEADLDEFCEDEFNPGSKMNRRVTFADLAGQMASSTDQTNNNKNHNNHNRTSDSTVATNALNSPLISTPTSESALVLSGNESSDSNALKPPLFERSSTGTASVNNNSNSSNNNDALLENLSHIRILVAEDNLVNQEVIKRMLKLEGFTDLTMACNGAEAIELIKLSGEQGTHYDIVFMDVQMPKVDGLTATKMIRSNLQFKGPIIALTAFADESNVKECLSSGMDGFLSKPIKRTNIRKIIIEFSPSLLRDYGTKTT